MRTVHVQYSSHLHVDKLYGMHRHAATIQLHTTCSTCKVHQWVVDKLSYNPMRQTTAPPRGSVRHASTHNTGVEFHLFPHSNPAVMFLRMSCSATIHSCMLHNVSCLNNGNIPILQFKLFLMQHRPRHLHQ